MFEANYNSGGLLLLGIATVLIFMTGCLPRPDYDQWIIDVVLLNDNVIISQTFRNVRVNEDNTAQPRAREKFEEWFCDDSSDTFRREWGKYADRMGMRSVEHRSIEVETAGQGSCDVQIQGTGRGFLPTAVVLADVLESDSYSVNRDGSQFRLSVMPSRPQNHAGLELNLWLSEAYSGRLVEANTRQFTRDNRDIDFGLRSFHRAAEGRSITWRRARWSTEKLSREGIRFTLDGPLHLGAPGKPGIDNQPTHIPDRVPSEP